MLTFSSLAFWAAVFAPTVLQASLCLLMAVFTVLILRQMRPGCVGTAAKLAGVAVALGAGYGLFNRVCLTWQISSKLETIARLVHLEYGQLLRGMAIAAAVCALPAVWFVTAVLADGAFRGARAVRWAEIWQEFRGAVRGRLLRVAVRDAVLVLGCAVLGALLLTGVFLLPPGNAENNMRESAEIFDAEEESYPRLYSWCHSTLDNFTDALMLLEASDRAEDTALHRAMQVYHGYISDASPRRMLIMHYRDGVDFESEVSYQRYWHGYLLAVKPLIAVTDYGGIRTVNLLSQLALVLLLSVLAVKKTRQCLVPFLLTWLMLMPAVLGKSLQFSSCFYIAVPASVVLLSGNVFLSERKSAILFLFIGVATAFFDFLTYPVAAFGLPCLVLLSRLRDEKTEKKIAVIFTTGISWSIGYLGMWVTKWLMGSLICGTDVFANALGAVSTRASASVKGEHITALACFERNIDAFLNTPFLLAVLCFLCLVIWYCLRRRHLSAEAAFRILLPYLLVGLLPFFWFAAARNHSYVHYFFTCKDLAVTCMALLCGAAELKQAA